jgi:hypothetical protein
MPLHLNKTPGAHELIPASATRASLGALSCPDSSRDAFGRQDEKPRLHRNFRSFGPHDRGAMYRCCTKAVDHWHWCDSLTTNYWNPPASESHHARQRIFAVIVAFILAAVLTHAGW